MRPLIPAGRRAGPWPAHHRSLLPFILLLANARESFLDRSPHFLLFGGRTALSHPGKGVASVCFVRDRIFALSGESELLLAQLLALLRAQFVCHVPELPAAHAHESRDTPPNAGMRRRRQETTPGKISVAARGDHSPDGLGGEVPHVVGLTTPRRKGSKTSESSRPIPLTVGFDESVVVPGNWVFWVVGLFRMAYLIVGALSADVG
jgi:hypothetical protein